MASTDDEPGDKPVNEALAMLKQGVESEPVSDNLRDLARRLAEVLADRQDGPPSPNGTSDRSASAG